MREISNPNNLRVVYEDNHLLVIDKRPGDIVQSDKTGDTCLIDVAKAYIKKKFDKPGDVYLGAVHRIDRPVGGLVVFGRTTKALARMTELFKTKEVKKTYWAIVEGSAPQDKELISWMIKDEQKNKSRCLANERPGAKKAVLRFQNLFQGETLALLEVELETGRHHQIRAQLSSIGLPIRGDVKYGAKRANKDQSIHLLARGIQFVHPVKKELLTLCAPIPDDSVWKSMTQSLSV